MQMHLLPPSALVRHPLKYLAPLVPGHRPMTSEVMLQKCMGFLNCSFEICCAGGACAVPLVPESKKLPKINIF
jgi:hypothetical protein